MTVALSTYDDIVLGVQDWLFGRTDLATKAPSFIRLLEAKANRLLKVRQMEGRSTATINLASAEPEFLSLPVDFHSMRRVRLKSVTGKPRLKFATGAQIDDFREKGRDVPGTPIWFSPLGDEIELHPTPNQAFVVEMVYRKYIPALAAANQTNWLITLAPDVYLYGALMEAAPYLHEDERIATWKQRLQEAIDELNKLNDEAQYNAGPLVMRRKGSAYS